MGGQRRGEEKWLLWLAVLPAETRRAARSTALNEQTTTKEKRREKFRQMKTHSAVFVPPSRLIVGHVDCVAAGLGGLGECE